MSSSSSDARAIVLLLNKALLGVARAFPPSAATHNATSASEKISFHFISSPLRTRRPRRSGSDRALRAARQAQRPCPWGRRRRRSRSHPPEHGWSGRSGRLLFDAPTPPPPSVPAAHGRSALP